MQDPSLVKRRARPIAMACGLASGALAVFWFAQILSGQVPEGDIRLFGSIFCFAVIAVSFFLFDRVQGDGRFLVLSWVPFLSNVASLAVESKYKFNVVGIVGLLAAVGFLDVFTLVQRMRERAAQPGVEPGGPAPAG
jgi:ABC-type transport system involved in cytochrome c biogenesis permease subunit